jgi:hypothetical protein
MTTSFADPRPTDPVADDVQPASDTSRSGLFELVERYAVAEFLPPAEWVTRLSLVEPRDNLRCLSR